MGSHRLGVLDPFARKITVLYRLGMTTRAQLIEAIAAACHQQNQAWCIAHGDMSQADWLATPANIRASAIDGVEHALTGAGPMESHQNWRRFKEADGWVYGPVKDVVAKTHPCMVPYSDLPPAQQHKDNLFIAMVVQMAVVLGVGPAS